MTEQELLELKEEINKAHREKDRAEGKLEHLTSQLQEKYKVKDIKEAKEKLKTLKSKTEKLQDKIKEGIEELEEKLEQ